MAARAMWKGIIRFVDVAVPVKLYAAVEDRDVHFRLLHAADQAPVKQALVHPDTDESVPYENARRAFKTPEQELVLLSDEDLQAAEPPESREIRILQFVPPAAVDHLWYVRPYYLGPDEGPTEGYQALAAALERTGYEGIARWTMRRKAYVGALRLAFGYPMLISLRHREEVIAVEELEPPAGPPLDERELAMAQQLVDMLATDFDPGEYHDQYRARVEELIQTKLHGGRLRAVPRSKAKQATDLASALEASLREERKRA